jgi:hypothetical protein
MYDAKAAGKNTLRHTIAAPAGSIQPADAADAAAA